MVICIHVADKMCWLDKIESAFVLFIKQLLIVLGKEYVGV